MNDEIKLFLKNDLNEGDYFLLPKENLLTLKDYLLQLKARDNEFTSAIEKQFQSIKKKCNWLSSISFGGFVHKNGIYGITTIYLYSNDGTDIIARYNNTTDSYEGLIGDVPKVYLVSRKVRKHLSRQKDIDMIQEELSQIGNIGRNMYRDILMPIYSISKNFEIHYTPHLGLSVYNKYELIANYFNCPEKNKEKEFLQDNESKEKLLSKILVKSKKQ